MTEAEALPRAPFVPAIRLVRLLWRMLGPIAVAALLYLVPPMLGASEAIAHQARVAAHYVLGFALFSSLVMELLSPRNKELRLLPIAGHRVERLAAVARGLLIILLGTELAIYLVRANGWSESAAALLAVLRTTGLILFAWSALSRSGLLKKMVPERTTGYGDLLLWLLLRVVLPLGVLTLLFYVVASAFGYEPLSRWVVQSAGFSACLLLGTAVLYRFLRRRIHRTITFMRDEQAKEAAEPHAGWIGTERILAGALKVLIGFGALHVLLAIWNLSLADVSAYLDSPVFAGGEHTWGTLVAGLVKVALVYVGYALARNVLIFFVFPRTGVEIGARYAILTVLYYAAIVFVVLFTFGAFGVDTSTLAVFAGGATVGLAFGMKDIFSNFFSGLIMLLERPVRVGDDIEVGETRGKIEEIRLRGTRIRTFDGTIVIVPNTDMIGSRIMNFSHGFETARMQINVGVSYGEDPQRVETLLARIVSEDPRVAHEPPPAVRFDNFGDSSLDFTIRMWTHQIAERWAMVSELRTKIFAAFREEGIEIPFPQRDLHIRSSDVPIGGAAGAPAVSAGEPRGDGQPREQEQRPDEPMKPGKGHLAEDPDA